MRQPTTKSDSLQPATELAVDLFDNWFDPIEAEVRARSREFVEELIGGELDAAPSFASGSTARRPRSRCSLCLACARTARRCCSRSEAWAARAPRPGARCSAISSSAG